MNKEVENEFVDMVDEVFQRMEAMAMDIKYTTEDRVEEVIPLNIYEEVLLKRR